MDLFGPMHDQRYILVMIDSFDGYLLLKKVTPTSLDIIKVILFNWIYTFDFIKKVTSDNGSYFVAKLNKIFFLCLGIKAVQIFTYTP